MPLRFIHPLRELGQPHLQLGYLPRQGFDSLVLLEAWLVNRLDGRQDHAASVNRGDNALVWFACLGDLYCNVTRTWMMPVPEASGSSALPTTAPSIRERSVPFIA